MTMPSHTAGAPHVAAKAVDWSGSVREAGFAAFIALLLTVPLVGLRTIDRPTGLSIEARPEEVVAFGDGENDKEFLQKSAANNTAGYQQFVAAFEQLGLEYVPSYGNFVLVKVGSDAGAGARVNLALLKQGVIVRPVGNYGLPEWLRISIGLPQENVVLIAALTKALAE